MLPEDMEGRLEAQQVEVVCDGICDAFVLRFFEKQREYPSKEWIARQQRKIDGGIKWLAEKVSVRDGRDFMVGGKFGLADIAAGTVCSYMDVRCPEYAWRENYPDLARYVDGLGERESFRGTVPVPQVIDEKIV